MSLSIPRVRLVAPLCRSGTGADGFLGLASDGKRYWVKAPDNPQGPRTLVAEVVSYGIGRLVGAPVPQNALIDIPDGLAWRFRDGRTMKAGVGHASLEIPNAVMSDDWAVYSALDDNRRRQAFILAVWDLCMGGDPHWLHQLTDRYSMWTIDHGFWLAGEADWDIASLRKIGVSPWVEDIDAGVASASALKEAAEAVEQIELESIRAILSAVPVDWNTTQAELYELATVLVARVEGVAERLRSAARHSRYPYGGVVLAYRYWLVRYVPNVARGEFVNIGILCGRDAGDWAVRFDTRSVHNRGQLGSDLHELKPWISWFERRIAEHASPDLTRSCVSEGWIAHLRERQANAIQFSEATPIEIDSAQMGVELLFPHLVERDLARRHTGMTRQKLRSEVRDTLRGDFALVEGTDFFVNPKAHIGKQRGTLDFLRRHTVSDSLLNVWAFNVAKVSVLEQQVQASNYFLMRMRNEGAVVELSPGRSSAVNSDAPMSVIIDPPVVEDERQYRLDVFEAALEAWELCDVTVVSLENFREMRSEEDLMQAAAS